MSTKPACGDRARRPRTAAIVNLGCKVNQSEMEAAARLLREAGVPLVDPDRRRGPRPRQHVHGDRDRRREVARRRPPRPAREPRRRDRRDRLLRPGRARRRSRRSTPAARLVGNDDKAAFLAELEALLRQPATRPTAAAGSMPPLPTLSGVEAVAAAPIDGIADDRASVERTRAFVKVQDGCSFYCTYCIIPRARGAERSLAPGRRPRGRAPRARRRPPRDRPDRDQHRHVRRRLVRARPPRLAHRERAHAGRASSAGSSTRPPSSGSASARSSRSTSTTSCSRPGSTARRGRCRTSTCRSSRATTACSAGWAAAT